VCEPPSPVREEQSESCSLGTAETPWSCEATPKERPWRSRPPMAFPTAHGVPYPLQGGHVMSARDAQKSQRKFARSALPSMVMMLSGWNWTAAMGNSL
jgi:hypothetical protein